MISTNTGLFHSYLGVYIKYTAASTFTLGILHRKLTHSNPKWNKSHIPRWFVKDGVEKGDIDRFSLGGFCLPWKSWYICMAYRIWVMSTICSHAAQSRSTIHKPIAVSMNLGGKNVTAQCECKLRDFIFFLWFCVIRCIYSNKSYA